MKLLSVLLPLVLVASCSALEKPVYLFSYFNGNGDGLHLAYSEDGKEW